jgi:outer membrane receptor protein involved in Fe transport
LIQEDGLPVLQFGDVAFGTQDQFVRFDNTINRVEALRGGSASILASNSPAGIINFISKTGEVEGGSVASTFGLDWNNFRTDFEYGAPISKDLFFHVGGFYRVGDGPRKTGYTSNNGGQMKASVTKKFNNGYVRIYGKMLNDRAAAYMPMPINVAGTNANPTWSSLSDYDAINGTLHSIFLTKDRTIGGNNNLLNSDVTDGMRSLTNALGTELSFNLGEGWKITNRARFAGNSGQFLAPFPASAGTYNDIFGGITNIKEAVYAGSWTPVPTTGTYMRVHLFNTKLNNFNNYMNDLTISKRLNDNIKLNLGMYKSLQNINMDWHWNTYFMKANTGTMNLVDVIATDSSRLTSNGLYAYGVPAWGNCCNRTIDTKYDITAPYANLEIKATDNLNIDGGIRYDLGHAFGSYNGGNGKTSTIDVNGDGTIQPNEVSVAGFDNNITAVNYGYNILGYSLGANYQLNDQSSLFGRVSRGGTAAADRVLFEGYNYVGNTDNTLNARKVNYVAQQELGYKYRTPKTALNATLFRATTKESNYEATTQKKTSNDYQSIGLELDGNVNLSQAFGIRGGLTAMSSKITNAIDTSIIGNTPRRTPAVMLNLMPTFGFNENKGMVGLNLLGVSKSFAQDNNKLVMPGYLVINPFFNYQVAKGLVLGLNGNNITNALGITESEEGSITENQNNFVRARPIPGRTISGSIRYNF